MNKKILVAYASKCGSTAEVAQAVADELCAAGASVDVRPARKVRSLDGYSAVILGTAMRMEKILPEAKQFAGRFKKQLKGIPVAYFSVGIGVCLGTAEGLQSTEAALLPLKEARQPVAVGLFAGKVDHAKLEPLMRFGLSFVKEGPLAGGDFRDWDAIRGWAREVSSLL